VKPWKVRCHTKTYYLNSFISLLSRNVFPNYLDAVDMFLNNKSQHHPLNIKFTLMNKKAIHQRGKIISHQGVSEYLSKRNIVINQLEGNE